MARLFGVSTKTLRHYDAIGLLPPARTDPDTGYRRYAPSQVEEMRRILLLRDLGVALEVIGGLLRSRAFDDPALLSEVLAVKAREVRAEIAAGTALLHRIEGFLDNLNPQGRPAMALVTTERPGFTVVGLRLDDVTPDTTIRIPPLWDALSRRRGEILGVEPGGAYGICIVGEPGRFDYLAGFRVGSGTPVPEGMAAFDVPAQRYATFTHRGPVATLLGTVQRIFGEWLPSAGLEPTAGPEVEFYGAAFTGPDDPGSLMEYWVPVRG
jgi:predicted transcriptional regulator YdeE/DNA-binding transcriptional MerR regulator